MEKTKNPHDRLNQLTCLALGRVAHIEDSLAVFIPEAEELLEDVKAATADIND